MPTTDPPAEPARGLRRWEQRVSLAGLRRRSLLRERRLAGADEDELQALRTSWGADAGAGSKVGVTRPLVVRDEATGRPAALYGPASSSEHCNDAPGCAIAKLERDVGARLVVALPPAFTYETFALRSDFCLESSVTSLLSDAQRTLTTRRITRTLNCDSDAEERRRCPWRVRVAKAEKKV
jgi:hypothetical protein